MLIICDHKDVCPNSNCSWRRPKLNGNEILDARCSDINATVSITRIVEVGEDDPNYKFMRKKNGL